MLSKVLFLISIAMCGEGDVFKEMGIENYHLEQEEKPKAKIVSHFYLGISIIG